MFRRLRANEIECRVAQIYANRYLTLLLYKDARVDMRVLDETVGPMNWKKAYSRDNANCTVSIWDDVKEQWISKEDTGTESNMESEKGLASDSFKRACFNWGIGRELYTAPYIAIPASACEIKEGRNGKPACYDRFVVKEIGYDEDGNINALEILNQSKGNEVVYKLGDRVEKKKLTKARLAAFRTFLAENNISEATIVEKWNLDALTDATEGVMAYVVNHAKELADGD